uniref:cytosolic sulfotransferase 3-like isoform X1 n=1 Tax=Styela clava TaxID=7725 RepID=UPI001939559F|nr:cytosolic sulfotransferase 3-like isoform X1 [Styela clava]
MNQLFASIPNNKKIIVQELTALVEQIVQRTFDFGALTCSEWKGYKFIPLFEADTAKRAYDNYEFEENTVLLASFPKTGTNWTAEIIRQIFYGQDEKLDAISKSIPPALSMLEVWKAEKLDLMEHLPLPRKLFATHLPAELINIDKLKKKNGKVVVLVRNPKYQAVSWYHFSKNHHFDSVRDVLSSDWNQFLSDYVQGKHPLITKPGEWYPEFLLGWNKHKGDSNVMFLIFENMKKDIKREIQRLATFLEVDITDKRVAAIAESTSFGAMKKNAELGVSEFAKVQNIMTMMRKGQVGGWKETFTVAQSELMDKIIEEKLGHTDIKFTYML